MRIRFSSRFAAAAALLSLLAGGALAQKIDSTGVRTDKGPIGSQTIPPPGAGVAPASTPGATPTNPGGLARDLGDVPREPHTAGGLPGRDQPKPASESAGKVDRASITEELKYARSLCARNNWPVIDVTRRSIEETAAAIVALRPKPR